MHRTHEFAEEYGLKATAFLGEFHKESAAERIKQIVIKLGRQGREGVVMKDPENIVAPLKYTSSETNCSDLAVAFRYYNDYALDFFVSRAVREGFQSVEWNESEEERKARALSLGGEHSLAHGRHHRESAAGREYRAGGADPGEKPADGQGV